MHLRVFGYEFAISRAKERQPLDRSQLVAELGFTGVQIALGIVSEEYNEKLASFDQRIQAWERMRRSEAAISVIEHLISQPIRAATWEVVADDPGQERMAEHISENLLHGMTHTWDDFLRHALLAVLTGFSVHEKVWEQRDGLLWLRKLAPRHPRTVSSWLLDDAGGLAGIKQAGFRTEGDRAEWVTVEIPIEKLLVFTYRGEWGNPEGFGLLRVCYKHWYFKEQLYKLAAIRVEREACGTPIGKFTHGQASEEERNKLRQILQRVRGYEEAGIVLPPGVELDNFQLGDGRIPWMDFIEHQHNMILQAALCQFAGMGQGDNTGTYALSQDASTLFLMALNATADWIADAINRYLIRQYVDYNWGRQKSYPRLRHGDIGVKNKKAIAEVIRMIFDPDLQIERYPEIEEYLREEFRLPPKPEPDEQRGALAEEVAAEKTAPLQFAAADLRAEKDFADKLRSICQRMIRQYLARLRPLAEKRRYSALREAKVPLVGAVEGAAREYLAEVAGQAAELIKRETGVEVPVGRQVQRWILAKAALLAERLASNIRWVVLNGLIGDLQGGLRTDAAMRNAERRMTDALAAALTETLPGLAGELVREMQGL
ncbi:phage portal protein family protein [Pseudomonas sp.]|uniref:phage portal protein family protein n=1 Tax=Pseudomonas sp. TaxID=306 RepID=UPI003D0976B3